MHAVQAASVSKIRLFSESLGLHIGPDPGSSLCSSLYYGGRVSPRQSFLYACSVVTITDKQHFKR